jgi:hypothetical protein
MAKRPKKKKKRKKKRKACCHRFLYNKTLEKGDIIAITFSVGTRTKKKKAMTTSLLLSPSSL